MQSQPTNFAGGVGRFMFDAQVKPMDLNAGDPITLTMTIAGEGNIENVSPPEINLGDQFKVYEAKLVSKDLNAADASGRKVFEQVLIPRSDEVKALPALTFSYFDPGRGTYETITRGPYRLTVHASSNSTSKVVAAADQLDQTRAMLLGTDIVYLKPMPVRWRRADEKPWYEHPYVVAAQALPPILLAAIFLVVRRRDELAQDVAKARRQQAPKSARTAIRKAEDARQKGDQSGFFQAVWEALASYFGNRLNLSPGEVSVDVVTTALAAKLESSRLTQLGELFALCEQQRFGSAAVSGTASSEDDKKVFGQTLDSLHEVLKACEKIRI